MPTTANLRLSEYREQAGEPYTAKLFGMGEAFDYLPAAVQTQLQEVEQFVEQELQARGWQPNLEAFDRTLHNLQLELGVDAAAPVENQLELLAAFARNVGKVNEIAELKQELRKRLRGLKSAKQMDNEVLKVIGKRII